MDATAEELLLLLDKWEAEAKLVVASVSIQPGEGFRCVFTLAGRVSVDRKAAVFQIESQTGDLVLCHISYKNVGYSIGKNIKADALKTFQLHPEEVDDVVVLRNPDLSTLCLFSKRETKN